MIGKSWLMFRNWQIIKLDKKLGKKKRNERDMLGNYLVYLAEVQRREVMMKIRTENINNQLVD